MVAGQESNTEETVKKEVDNYKNQIDLGIEILAPSFSYTRKINENIRIGAGFGFGYSFAPGKRMKFNKSKGIALELLHIGSVIEFKLTDILYYEFKPQLSIVSEEFEPDGLAIGLKNGLFIKLSKVKLGLNLTVGKSESDKWLFYIQPLQLKIPIRHW